MIPKRAQCGLVRWLAFVALALIVFASPFSRAMHTWPPVQDVASLLASDCPQHAAHPHHPRMPGHPDMPDGDVCGYCTLIGHSPPLASGVAFLVLPLPPAPFSATFRGAHAPAPTQLDQRSRGPPVA